MMGSPPLLLPLSREKDGEGSASVDWLKLRPADPRKRAHGADQEAEKRRPEGVAAEEDRLVPYSCYKT